MYSEDNFFPTGMRPTVRETASVSVVVPCFRCGATIHRAVESVLAQTQLPLELILVDDASGDGTLEVLLELQRRHGPSWVKVITLHRNAGVASARNAGWEAAGGDYVAFLDADDAWHPEKIRLQYEFMMSHPEFILSGHGHRRLEAFPRAHAAVTAPRHESVTFRALLFANRFITPSAMIRRDAPCRFHGAKRHMEDFLLWLTIAARGSRIAYLDAELAYVFKALFGQGGLSAATLLMERGELDCYWQLHRGGHLGMLSAIALSAYSCIKFLRRIMVLVLRGGQSLSR